MRSKKPNFVRIPWRKFDKKFLESIKDLPKNDVKSKLLEKIRKILNSPECEISFNESTFIHVLSAYDLSRKPKVLANNQWTRLSEEEREAFKAAYINGSSSDIKKSIEKTYPNAQSYIIHKLAEYAGLSGKRLLKGAASVAGKRKEDEEKTAVDKKYVLELLTVLANEPTDLPISLIAGRMKITTEKTKEYLNFLRPQLEKKGYNFVFDKVKNQITVSRKSFELLEPKVFAIELSEKDYYGGGANVGAFSGFSYGSDELFREGLLELNQFVQKQNKAHFLVLCAGLVNGGYLENELKAQLRDVPKKERKGWEALLVSRIARELSVCLPKLKKPDGKLVKLYIITSPKKDKAIGTQIAIALSELRKDDIVYFGNSNDQTLPVKHVGSKQKKDKVDVSLLPVSLQRSGLRSKFASTKIQSQIRTILKVLKVSPDFAAFGGYGVNIHKPAIGEVSCPYIGVPELHALSERETSDDSESEIGTRVIKFRTDGNYTVTTSDFKYLVNHERQLIKAPASASDIQKQIIEVIKERSTFIGVIEEKLGVSRDIVKKEIDELAHFKAGIVYDKATTLYDFSKEWVRSRIRYRWPEKFNEDIIVSFACLHSLATYPDGTVLTDCKFILEQLPKIILRENASILVGSGDFIQGSKVHGLHLRGEVFLGLNLNTQEHVAAYLVQAPIMEVFKTRFDEFMRGKDKKTVSKEELIEAIKRFLVTFVYCAGNHDLWQTSDAVQALAYFRLCLENFLMNGIATVLRKYEMHIGYFTLQNIVFSKIVKDLPDDKIRFVTANGLKLKTIHPHTARNETLSIPPERLLSKYSDAHIVIAGNWHTAFDIQQSDENMGLRHMVQVPTLLLRTFFEDNKMKRTDFGVNVSFARSVDKQIYEIETGFFGDKIGHGYERENNGIMEDILHRLNLDVFSSKHGK
ncbi:MAG: hypothetical protein AAB556_00390 [Patescibacteria group bacterium]